VLLAVIPSEARDLLSLENKQILHHDKGAVVRNHNFSAPFSGPDWPTGGKLRPEASLPVFPVFALMFFAFDRMHRGRGRQRMTKPKTGAPARPGWWPGIAGRMRGQRRVLPGREIFSFSLPGYCKISYGAL